MEGCYKPRIQLLSHGAETLLISSKRLDKIDWDTGIRVVLIRSRRVRRSKRKIAVEGIRVEDFEGSRLDNRQ